MPALHKALGFPVIVGRSGVRRGTTVRVILCRRNSGSRI